MFILLKSVLEVSATTEFTEISYKSEWIESLRPQRSAKCATWLEDVATLYGYTASIKISSPYRLNGTSVADEAKKSNRIQHFSLSENDSKQEFKSGEVQ